MNQDKYVLHSGGALGSDMAFDFFARLYDLEIRHYYYGARHKGNAPLGNVELTEQEYLFGQQMGALAGNYMYGFPYKRIRDVRIARNYKQVIDSEAIFAIGKLANKGEHLFNDNRVALRQCCTGGTGYAVAMGILKGIPVYVYDQLRKSWTTFNYQDQVFEFCDCPKLTKSFAGIGTREINEDGFNAIKQLFENTFGELNAS